MKKPFSHKANPTKIANPPFPKATASEVEKSARPDDDRGIDTTSQPTTVPKKHSKLTKASPPPPKPVLNTREYESLPADIQVKYRPVDPRHERLPLWSLLLYALAGICLILYTVMSFNPVFADWFNRTVSATGRSLLATLTAPFPFSLGEATLFLLPLILILSVRYAARHRCETWRTTAVYIGIMGSVAVTLFSVFVLNFAAGYRARPLDEKLELDRHDLRAEELYDTALHLIDCINRETAAVTFYTDDFSIMPYTLEEMNRHLSDAYVDFTAEHDFIRHNSGRVKPVLVSEVMSYMHITGVYSFFTGEANINVNFPAYTIPYTAAHEMAHQRGIAREDEANFVAFLVCIGSDDPYIRYSGYLNLYEFVANALWRADKELYSKAVAHLNGEVKAEMTAYNQFFDRYKESTVSHVSSSINNSYLQSQGTPGTRSYGMVVDLAVAYYQKVGM